MRITTRLRIISIVTIAAFIVLAPILVWSFIEFSGAKNDYTLADAIKVNFFERSSFRDQYFLYREDRARDLWYKSKETSDQLLHQAEFQFHDRAYRETLEHLRKNIDDTAVIFRRIVDNTKSLKTASGNLHIYEELDRRLYSQLLLKATTIRDGATALKDASSRRVELAYKHLAIIIGLFAATLALATLLVSIQLGRLIRKRLAPLHDGAKIVADGNLNYRIKAGSADEFSELALSINAMTDKLNEEISAHQRIEIALRDSEAKLQAVLNASEVAIAWANEVGAIEYINPKFTALFGYTLTDVPTVEQWYLHAYPDAAYRAQTVDEWNAKIASSLPERTAMESMEVAITCKDGSVRHALLMGSWFGTRLLANFSDITARKNAEEALHDSEQRYHFLFDNNPMPMWVCEEDSLKFLVVNDRAVEHYGFTREEFSRMTLRDIRPAEDIPETMRAISDSLNKKYSGEWRHTKKDGTIIDVTINTVPMKYGNTPARIVLIQDITERKQIEERIKELNRDFVSFLENTSDFIYFKDADSRFRFCSQTLADITGHASWRDMIGKHDLEVFPHDTAQIYHAEELPIFRDGTPLLNKIDPYYDASGNRKWVSTNKWPLLNQEGKVSGLFGISRDITESKVAEEKLQKSEARLRAILDNVPYLVWLKDINGRFIAVNKAFFNTTGQARIQDVLGKTDFDLWPEQLAQKYRADDTEVLSSRRQKLTEEMSMDNGEVHWVETFKAPITDMDGNLLGTTGFAQDITGRKNAEGKIRHLAHYDPLTDLPNRTLFSDRLQQALVTAKRDKAHMALMFLDLDKFKPINDTFGHHVGDLLLKEAAKRMQDCVRESDTVARIGGDEFVILLPVIEATQDALLVAEKIRLALNQSFVLVGQSLNISSSTGIAVYPEHGKDEKQLVKNADIAMYHAKNSGRDNVMLYQPDMQDGL